MKYGRDKINGEVSFEIYDLAFKAAESISEEIAGAVKNIPKNRGYMSDLICKHSRLVCVHLEEAWRVRGQAPVVLDRLSAAAQAASKTQDILRLASKRHYIDGNVSSRIDARYEEMFDDLFEMLCDRRRLMEYPKQNFRRETGCGEIVFAA